MKSDHFIVLGIRRRTLPDLSGFDMHACRNGGSLRHVDRERSHLNRALIGEIGGARASASIIADELALAHLRAKIAGLKKRRRKSEMKALRQLAAAQGPRAAAGDPWDHKNTKPFFDGILSASAEHFASGCDADPTAGGEPPLSFEDACRRRGWNPVKVEQWIDVARAFLGAEFGDDLIALRVDLDERTPHLHFVGAPRAVDGKGRPILSQRLHRVLGDRPEFEGDPRTSYERLLDRAGEHFAPLGLLRGERKAALERGAEALGLKAAEAAEEMPLSPEDGRRMGLRILGEAEEKRIGADKKLQEADAALAVVKERSRATAKALAEALSLRERARKNAERAKHRERLLHRSVDLIAAGDVFAPPADDAQLKIKASPAVVTAAQEFGPADATSPTQGMFAALRGSGLRDVVGHLARRWRDAIAEKMAALDRFADQLKQRAFALDKREAELDARERDARDCEAAIEKREADVAVREAAVDRDIVVLEAAQRAFKFPVSASLAEAAGRAHQRLKDRRPVQQ
jgi:hypothetical protein